MHRIMLLLCLVVAASTAWAADPASAPNATTTSSQAVGAVGTQPPECPARPPSATGSPSNIVVELDPNTLWRPRGAEVRFTVRSPGVTLGVAMIRVCFGWASIDATFRERQALVGSPQVRSVSNPNSAIEYGAMVPFMDPLPSKDWWPKRLFWTDPYIFTGAGSVPVADMIVEVTTTTGQVVVTATQVGVTKVPVAWIVVALVTALIWLIMDSIVRYRGIRGRNLLLRVISTSDGYASLSQFQIVLWTLVVGLSAIYVMTLSGNLVEIGDGTLILLGIASGAGLAARVSEPPQKSAPPVPVVPAMPEWSDLLIPDRASREVDVTRLQMLTFTLITAAFVVVKVFVDYEIPTIPSNFLLLMGISNGVYIGGKRLPSQPKNAGTAADPQG
jgi:hypothetical protein